MAEEKTLEKPKTLAELYPDFEDKYRAINAVYVALQGALKAGNSTADLMNKAKELLDWANGVIESFMPVTELEQKIRNDTATFSLGLRLAKDELLLKQLYISMIDLQGLISK